MIKPILGESPEAYRRTAEWVRIEVGKLDREERARRALLDAIDPMIASIAHARLDEPAALGR